MASTTRRSSHSGSSSTREYLVIIQPDEGRRFKLNLKGEVRHLTLAKVKQCLATASSCSIPQTMMELKLNGIPLHEDGDLCGSLGISSGTALTLQRTEAPKASSGGAANAARVYSTPDDLLTSSSAPQQPVAGPLAAPHPDALLSPPRHQIELQTLQEQQWYLLKDQRAREEVMQQTMHHMEDQLQQAAHQRMMLEKHRRLAQDGILRLQQREAEAMREKEKLEWLQAEEAKRAAQRAEDLSARREQLRAEQEAIRSVALQTLELEQRKEMLAKQKVAYEVEQERVRRVQASFEAEAKARAMQLKAKEVDIEQARLASAQQERELQEEQDRAARQMEYYYDNHGEAMAGSFVGSAEAPRGTSINSSGVKSRPFTAQQYFTNTPAAKAPGGAPLRGGVGARSTSRPATARGAASPRGPTAVDPRTPHDALVLPDGGYYSPRENAEENLRRLGEDLGMAETLRFDEQNTCVISVDGEYTLLITFDADTERIFLYSTLLTALPADDPFLRLRLYDFLMEGALLGREMCGGGIGASLRNDFVLMSTSIYMPTSQPWSLRTTAPQFVQSLHHWRIRVNDFLAQETENRLGMRAGGGTATAAAAGAAAMASPPVVGHRPRGSTAATTPHAEAGKGSRSSPVIGLEVVDTLLLNGSAARYRDGGVLIVGVSGPSAASGVLPHDVLKKINHITINDAAIFQEACRSLVPGEVAKLTIERNGLESVLAIQVGASAVYDLPR